MKKLLIAILFLCSVFSKAQVAGYMGKRLIVGVENSASLNFPVLLYLDKHNRYYFGPAISTALRMDYVLSDRKAVSFCVRHFSKKFEHGYSSYQSYTIVQERLNLVFYSLGMKRYARRSIAPLGFFTKWEAAYINGWINYEPWTALETYGNSYRSVEKPGGTVRLNGASGAFSVGYQRIFRDRFAVEYGARAALYIPIGSGANYYERELLNESTEAYTFPVFNVFIGVGLLAF